MFKVLAGAWVAFTNKNYKGTCFYHFEGNSKGEFSFTSMYMCEWISVRTYT